MSEESQKEKVKVKKEKVREKSEKDNIIFLTSFLLEIKNEN